MSNVSTNVSLADVTVQRADGEPVRIGDLVDRPTVLVVPRYYGCMPCRDYLHRVEAAYGELQEAGGAVLGCSGGLDIQAQALMDGGVPFPLLVDPERKVFEALELRRTWRVVLNPKGWWNYLKAIVRRNRQGRVVDPIQTPGLAVLDAQANVVSIHRGTALGDYPPVPEVIAQVSALS